MGNYTFLERTKHNQNYMITKEIIEPPLLLQTRYIDKIKYILQ